MNIVIQFLLSFMIISIGVAVLHLNKIIAPSCNSVGVVKVLNDLGESEASTFSFLEGETVTLSFENFKQVYGSYLGKRGCGCDIVLVNEANERTLISKPTYTVLATHETGSISEIFKSKKFKVKLSDLHEATIKKCIP